MLEERKNWTSAGRKETQTIRRFAGSAASCSAGDCGAEPRWNKYGHPMMPTEKVLLFSVNRNCRQNAGYRKRKNKNGAFTLQKVTRCICSGTEKIQFTKELAEGTVDVRFSVDESGSAEAKKESSVPLPTHPNPICR